MTTANSVLKLCEAVDKDFGVPYDTGVDIDDERLVIEKCPRCRGFGGTSSDADRGVECGQCGGSGKVGVLPYLPQGVYVNMKNRNAYYY